MPELNRRKKVPFLFIFLVLFLASSSSAQENFFPFKNKASQVVAEVTVDRDDTSPGGTAGVTVDVTIPLKHHAYLDRGEKGFYIPVEFDFSKLGPLGIEVNKVSVPEGKKDEDFGATVLRGTGRYEWDFSSKDMINFDSLPKFKISYQVCNDETKICFPPGSLFVSFTESGAETAKVEEPEPVKPETESEADGKGVSEVVSDKFKQYSTNFFLSFFIILAAGLLAAGTPCVYPMLPITCTILMNRGKGSKTLGNYHTISYFLGIVFIYILLGYLAGMTGGAFSTFMRSATVNLFFSFLFILLGLAMLGFFQMSVGENF
ncbi:MAG: cytochrome c biogenesis protein CcdA, partial [Nitrospinota bacterium]